MPFDLEEFIKVHRETIATSPELRAEIETLQRVVKRKRIPIAWFVVRLQEAVKEAQRAQARAKWEREHPEAHAAEQAALAKVDAEHREHAHWSKWPKV